MARESFPGMADESHDALLRKCGPPNGLHLGVVIVEVSR